jgi:hypothetical protein
VGLPKIPAPLRRQVSECLLGRFVRKVVDKYWFVTLFVTPGRRTYAIVVRQSEAPGSSEGVRKIVGSMTGQPSVMTASRIAYAAGTTLILARSRNQ